jgi:AcrR family transcriptional regulator
VKDEFYSGAPPTSRDDQIRSSSARERLLASANELFYSEGVQSVGIERVIERAGVAKASLYNLFGNKEGLVRAYLEARHEGTSTALNAAVDLHRNPRRRILAVFEAQAQVFAQPGFRGCAFVSALAEAPPGGMVDQSAAEFRASVRALFTDLAQEAGAQDPTELGRQLQVIYDGGMLAAWMDHDPLIATSTRAAAEALLNAAL